VLKYRPAPFKCIKCDLSHFTEDCPDPCTSHLPCALKPEYSSAWPCQVCLDRDALARARPWDSPTPASTPSSSEIASLLNVPTIFEELNKKALRDTSESLKRCSALIDTLTTRIEIDEKTLQLLKEARIKLSAVLLANDPRTFFPLTYFLF